MGWGSLGLEGLCRVVEKGIFEWGGGKVAFPFALERASRQTALSVFSLDGQLVRRLELDSLSARRFSSDRWDGRNNIGELVQSGIYYYVLETDGQHRRGKMAVLVAE